MAVTVEDVRAMVAGAVQRAAEGWMPPRTGAELSTKLSDDQPPLTTGIVDMYLAAYTWLWQRETPADEAQRVTDTIAADAATAWARNDFRVRNGVLAVCALWEEVRQLPGDDQDRVRELLGNTPAPGEYPELEPPPAQAESAAPSVGFKKELVTTDDVVMGMLNTQAKLGPSI